MSTPGIKRYTDFLTFANDLAVPLPTGAAPLGSAMADFQRRDFEALTPSLHALATGTMPPIRRFWIERTKGGSKDTDSAVGMLYLLGFAGRAVRMQVIADDQQQASEIRLIVEAILGIQAPLNRLLAEVIKVQRNVIISTRNGSTIEILTRDDSGSHGARPDLVLANELSHIGDEGFASTVVDNADKVPSSVVLVATNGGFTDSWQFRWREIAKTSERWYFSALTEPAPWISQADLEESQRRNPAARFLRLWKGQWVRGVGDALDEDDIQAAVTMRGPLTGTEPGLLFGAGLDLSTRRDHSALVVLAADPVRGRVKLASCESWKPGSSGIDLMAIQRAVYRAHNRFANCGVLFDPFQGELMGQQLRAMGIPMFAAPFTATRLGEMASSVLQAFRERRIDLYPDPELLSDLGRLGIADRGSFGLKLTAPADPEHGHADRAMALAIALPAALKVAMGDHPTAISAAIESEQRQLNHDPSFGLPIEMVDRPFDMNVEYPRRSQQGNSRW